MDGKPLVLALHEAQMPQQQDLADLQIDGYLLHMDGIYMAGGTARTCVYTSTSLTVKIRPDLMSDDLAIVALTLGSTHQKRFNIISFYRQWTVINTDPIIQANSKLVTSQAERFSRICDIWAKSV